MRSFTVAALLIVALAAFAAASDVVILDETNFDTIVNGDKHVFIEFFAPWCGHCKSLAPEYEIAASAFKSANDVVVASVDADAHSALGARFEVKGFPTLKYFPKGGDVKAPEAYSGGRTAADIVTFLNDKTGARGFVRKPQSAVKVLNDVASFDAVVDGSKHVLVEFYAPWCGHCKTLAPKWDSLAKMFLSENDVVIANVDADSEGGRPLGSRYGVSGFPTIKYFPKGSTEAVDYSSGREVADLVTFLNEKAGTQRLATGGLTETAGRIEAADKLAAILSAGTKSSVAGELAAVFTAMGETVDKVVTQWYTVVAKKFETDGAAFITKQQARLTKLLSGASISQAKKDELTKKLNILKAFVKLE